MKQTTRTRVLSWLLSFALLLGMFPAVNMPASAAGKNDAGEDIFQIVLADGTKLELTEDALRAEAESHIDDEDDFVTIDGVTMTWGQYKSMLAIMDLQDILNDESVRSANMYDEEHMPYTQSLMKAMLGAPNRGDTPTRSAGGAVETTVKLKKKTDNAYAIDTANTTDLDLDGIYTLENYYIEDDGVEDNAVTVDAVASDFTAYNNLDGVTMSIQWRGRVKNDTANHAKVKLVATRAEGSAKTQEAKLAYTIYESSGSEAKTGEIIIPAEQNSAVLDNLELNDYASGSKEANGLPGVVYVRYEPVSGCKLTVDDDGNPINSAACILGNDYNAIQGLGFSGSNFSSSISGFRNSAGRDDIMQWQKTGSGYNIGELNYTINIGAIKSANNSSASRFRLLLSDNGEDYSHLRVFTDSSATMTTTLRVGNSSGTVLYTTTSKDRQHPSIDWIKFSDLSGSGLYVSYKLDKGAFSERSGSYTDGTRYTTGFHYLGIQAANDPDFSAAVPTTSKPVYQPGDVVPVLVRSAGPFTTDASKLSLTVTYNKAKGTASETLSSATAVDRGCSALFLWTAPQDWTGGTLTLSDFKYDGTAVDGWKNQDVNASINYSNKLACFDLANATTALSDEGLVLKLPIRVNTNSWWEWISGDSTVLQAEEPYIRTMYATFGSGTEKQKLYLHVDETGTESVDYAFIKLPDGQINAVHIWYEPTMTNNADHDITGDSLPVGANVKDAYYSDPRFFIAGLSGASVEFPVAEYDPATRQDTKPENQTYYTLAEANRGDLVINYDGIWNHFAGNDANTDTVTADSVTKLVPPNYETYITDHKLTPMTLSYTFKEKSSTTNKKYSFLKAKYYSWESSNENVATIESKTVTAGGVEKVTGTITFTGNIGEVSFSLVCANGKHPVAVASAKLNVSDSPDPYLFVPSTSSPVVTRQGMPATVRFTTNIAQRNSALAGNDSAPTSYSIEVRDAGGNKVYSPEEPIIGSMDNPISSITIPEGILNTIGVENYTAVVTAVYNGDKVSLGTVDKSRYQEKDGKFVFKAETKLTVKAKPASVTMTLPKNLNGEESNYVMDTDSPIVSWTVNSNTPENVKWKYEVRDSAGTKLAGSEGIGAASMPTSWDIPKTDPGKLKEIYTVSTYITNDEQLDGWTVVSTRIYVYNGTVLDILIHPSEHIASGATADKAKLDNRELLRSYLSDDGKTLDLSKTNTAGNKISLAELQHDVNLSTVISLNFGDYVWGNISDQIKWSAEGTPEDTGVLYYNQASQYVNLNDLALDSVFPTGTLVEQGLRDGTVKITATHAGNGQSTSVEIDVDRVDDVFYLFQFKPKAKTEVQYRNGTGENVTVYTNDQGQLALLEENGIDKSYPIYLKSTADVKYLDGQGNEQVTHDVPFVGLIEPGELLSGEVDDIQHEFYPINTHTLASPGQVNIYLQKPDGKPLEADTKVTYRGGAYYGGKYAERADIFLAENRALPYLGDENTSNGLQDAVKAVNKNGALEFFFNIQQVADGELDYSKDVEYVFELRIEGYRPALVRIHPYQSSDVTATLRSIYSAKQIELKTYQIPIKEEPFTNQIVLHRYTASGAERVDLLPETGNTSKIGPNGQFATAALEYETILWNYGDLIKTKDGRSTLKANHLTQYLYDKAEGDNTPTTLGKGYTVRNKTQTSEVWVYPFSTVPIATTWLHMNKDCFGVNEDGSSTGNTWLAKYKWAPADLYLYDGKTSVMQLPFTYGIFNGVGMNEVTTSRTAMSSLQSAIHGIADDMTTFRLTDDGVLMNKDDFLNPMIDLLNGVMNNGEGFTIKPYFAPTADPTTYYVFMNMEKGTISNIVDSVIGGSDPGDELSDYIENTSQYGINPSYEDYENMFKKFSTAKDEEGNDITLDSFANRHLQGVLDFGGGGAMLLRAEYEPEVKQWHLYYLSGSFDMFIQMGFSKHFYIDGIVVGIGAEVGVDKLFMASNHYETADIQRHDLIRQLSIGGGIECFVGQGFDCIVKYELGIVGQVKYTSSNAQMTSTLAHYYKDGRDLVPEPIKGNKKSITGRIALRLTIGVLFVSKTWDLASTKFELEKWANQGYDNIRDIFEGKATYSDRYGPLANRNLLARYTAVPTEDGELMLTFENERITSRQLLRAVSLSESIYRTYQPDDNVSDVAISDDGNYVFFLDDNIASWAGADGTAKGTLIASENRPQNHANNSVGDYGHFYLDASGTGNNLFAVWSTQTQEVFTEAKNDDPDASPAEKYTGEVTEDDLGAALNSTEITVSRYDGGNWITQNLTKNNGADVFPKIASSGNQAVVAWIGGLSTGTSSSAETDDPILNATNFDVDSKILYSRFDGTNWSDTGIVLNTAVVGNVSGMDIVMLDDGSTVVAYTIQTDPAGSPEGQEVYYSILAPDGEITTSRVTDNKVPDGNVKLVSLGNEAVLAWYTEEEVNNTLNGNIRLLGIQSNGQLDGNVPESIAVEPGTSVVGGFEMAGRTLNGLTICWPLSEEARDDAIAVSSALYGVQLYSDGERTVVSPVQKLEGTAGGSDIALNAFRMSVSNQTVNALLSESDYTTGNSATYNLDIGESVTLPVGDFRLEKKSGTFKDTLEISNILYNEELVSTESELPIWFTVKNAGAHKITSLSLDGKEYPVTLYPGESTELQTTVEFDLKVTDYHYTISAVSDGSYPAVSDTIRFNVPEVVIKEMGVSKTETPGERLISMQLSNDNDLIPLVGSGRTLTVGLYTDILGGEETKLTEATVDRSDYTLLDHSSLNVTLSTSLDNVNAKIEGRSAEDDIPENGIPLYAIAEVKDGDTILSTARSLTTIQPLILMTEENADLPIETNLEYWEQEQNVEQEQEQGQNTETARIIVSYTNPSLKEQNYSGLTRIMAYDDKGLLLVEQFIQNDSTKTLAGDTTEYQELKLELPKRKTLSLVTVETVDEIEFAQKLNGSGYRFNGWYTDPAYKNRWKPEPEKDEEGKDKKDEEGNVIYQPIEIGEDGLFTVYAKWSRNHASENNGLLLGGVSENNSLHLEEISDLDADAWYYDGVQWALEQGVMKGVSKTEFRPNLATSRAMIVTMLHRMEGEPKSEYEMTFQDVPVGQWYTEAIRWAAENKIVSGYTAEAFCPDDDLTREQLATILWRYSKFKGIDTDKGEDLPAYEDAGEISNWAAEAVRWAVNANVMQGVGNSKLSPKTYATRAQVATMLMRYTKSLG